MKLIKILKINRESLLFFLLGIITIFLFAPFNLFPLGFFIYSYLAIRLFNESKFTKILHILFYFYLGLYFANYYWISFSFLVNKSYILLFPIIFIIIPLYFTIFSSSFLCIIYLLKQRYKLSISTFYLCFTFLLCIHEILRGHILPFIDLKGLPWNLLGYSFAINSNLLQIIDIIGIYGLTFILIYLFCSFIFILSKSKIINIIIVLTNLLILLSIYFYGYNKIENSNTKAITDSNFQLIHTNISKHHAYNNNKIIDNIDHIIDIINQAKLSANIIILPEGSIPIATEAIKEKHIYNPAITYVLENIRTDRDFNYLITGSATKKKIKTLTGYFNSLHNIKANGEFQSSYDKVNLVPFGEYIPYLNIFPRIATQTNFLSGKRLKYMFINNLQGTDISYIPLICYDGIFSGKMNKDGDFLLNISNDIWFTKKILDFNVSLGSWQHFDHIRFRAIEEGKPLIRVTNYGITGVVDSYGRVINKLDFNDHDGSIITKLPHKLAKKTFFNQYRNLIAWLFMCINSLVIFIILFRKRL